MEDTRSEPLLSNFPGGGGGDDDGDRRLPVRRRTEDEQSKPSGGGGSSTAAAAAPSTLFVRGVGDIGALTGAGDFLATFAGESRRYWYLAGPAIFTSVCRYSLGAITQVFTGQIGTLELAAVSVEKSVIAGFSFGILLGMGSALETLCGQAYGAGQLEMMGVYMQRSWVILLLTALLLLPLYVFAEPMLLAIGQEPEIAGAAGEFALWMLPQLFAYALNLPIAKFLQAQSRIMVMAAVAAAALCFHVVFSWLLMIRLQWGLVGAAVVLNASWWLIVAALLAYIFGGACGRAWSGFSWKAFSHLRAFAGISFASAVMLCLETWYFMALILFAGYLKNPQVSVDALSICMNILGWATMVAIGSNAATSVRVSNELGAAHPRTAKFVVVVVVTTAFMIGCLISLVLILSRKHYPSAFTNNDDVKKLVYDLTPLLAASIIVNNIQPVLSGVAIGAGWQALIAYVNIGCYYAFGIPLGLTMGYWLDLGVKGIWYGMLSGTVVQTLVLFWLVYRTNWNKEVSDIEGRIRKWTGETAAVSGAIDA